MLHMSAWQSIPISHETNPIQLMSQFVPPHVMGPSHELCSSQWMLHAVAWVQLMPPPHATKPQLTSQGMPGGQTTWFGQELVAVQLMTQVSPTQVPIPAQSVAHVGPPSFMGPVPVLAAELPMPPAPPAPLDVVPLL